MDATAANRLEKLYNLTMVAFIEPTFFYGFIHWSEL